MSLRATGLEALGEGPGEPPALRVPELYGRLQASQRPWPCPRSHLYQTGPAGCALEKGGSWLEAPGSPKKATSLVKRKRKHHHF